MSALVKHIVKVGQTTTVGDVRRGLARCPRDARVTLSYGPSGVEATWIVEAEPPDRRGRCPVTAVVRPHVGEGGVCEPDCSGCHYAGNGEDCPTYQSGEAEQPCDVCTGGAR